MSTLCQQKSVYTIVAHNNNFNLPWVDELPFTLDPLLPVNSKSVVFKNLKKNTTW